MLTELAEAASEAAQVRALGKLWVFPTLVLCLPMERQSTRARARYLATRLKMWRSDALEPLLDSVPVVDGQHLRPIPPEAVEHRIVQHVRANHIGAAARLVESAGVHDVTDSVLARLRELHPEAGARSGSHDAALVAPVESVSIDQLQCMRVPWDAQAVRKSILAIPHTSGCGPSRWSIGVLQQVIRTPVAGDTALGAVALAFKRIASVGLHPQAGALWSHARLIPLKKKDGGVRPIAVGELLRRVLGKLVLAHLGSDAAESLRPDQYGVGRPAGLEGAVLGTRLAAMQSPGTAVLLVDIANAFNCVDRPTLMRIVQGRFPALWPLVRSTYAHPAPLRVGAHVLASACGVQQGDPLGPLLFSLVLHKVLADTESPGLSSFWYLDDGSIVGPLAQLEGFLDAFSSDAAVHGMCVNRTKTQLVLPPGMHTAVVPAGLADLPRLAWDQAQLLGVPLDFTGSGESLVPITNASAQVLQLAEQVAKLSHPEEAFYLLRGSVGPKRLMHLARTMPPPVVTRIFAEFDRAWRSIVARALGVMAHEVGEPCKAEWRLPCSLGGLGLTAVADIAPFAFAAGSRAAARVVDNPPARVYPPSLAQWWRRFDGDAHAVAQWRLEPDEDVEALLDSQARGSRRFYRQWCSDWSHAPAPSDPDFHRRRSVSSPHALAWLGMPSATQLAGTHGSAPLSAAAWRVAVRHMLACREPRSAASVSGAIGQLGCRLRAALTSTVTTRSRHLGRRARGAPSRRGGRLALAGRPARDSTWVDVAVVVPDRTGTRRSDGAALAAAARRKQASFQAAARTGDAAGVSFQAVILDTYGRREQCGAAFLETLVAAYMRHRGVSKMLASTALHRSLSLAVYRSVAAAVLLRHPGPTLPVASQHWLETGRRLFVGEVLSESEAESH
ncbi:RNA-directed DNA polymerase from mobile element jockey [Porphyridium purpureum]|uniref:RNA-directed DNA polymerase from mobile element jockey n=1 Tax=Porphyridium purpureum TaxID=35688 RepID=A0A5J4YFP8_PORPP|nr:RNA-directed DNA polymerase from mobile element jockey [Porphyridium purpureum]|eukprot:POR5872..scf252_32